MILILKGQSENRILYGHIFTTLKKMRICNSMWSRIYDINNGRKI